LELSVYKAGKKDPDIIIIPITIRAWQETTPARNVNEIPSEKWGHA